MLPRSRRIVALCCATGLVLAACGSDTGSEAAPSISVTAAPDATSADTAAPDTASGDTAAPADTDGVGEPAAVVPATLQFSAPLVGGGTFDGASVAGAPVVFWFWAPG
jgi:hypothetical protein